MKVDIARLLKEEGYIRDYHALSGESFDTLVVELRFGRNRERIITDLKGLQARPPHLCAQGSASAGARGMGTAILSTSSGVITSRTAEERGVGGEVICFVW